jgi:hypothetical protein
MSRSADTPQQAVRKNLANARLLAVAGVSMMAALVCQNMTLTSQDYRGVLLAVVVCTGIALACCAPVFRRGGVARWGAVIIALPSIFIIFDLLRRAPFRWRFTPL